MKISKTILKKAGMLALSLCIAIISFITLPDVAAMLPLSLAKAIDDRRLPFDDVIWQVDKTAELTESPESTAPNETSSQESTDIAVPDVNSQDFIDNGEENVVRAVNLCRYNVGDTPSLLLMNYSNYKINPDKYLGKVLPFAISDISLPTVLIIHTHGSECYLPHGTSSYSGGETYRSTDAERGVVSVGRELARVLRENGIGVIHDETMYDVEDFNTSYVRSKKAVSDYLKQYPTIKCVIDLHRDSIFTSSGENQKPVCNIGGADVSQVMLVVGTDQSGAAHPDWQDNMTFAVALQNEMNNRYPTFARPINVRTSSFNQQLCKGMLLIEVGACGNTITESRAAAKLLGKCLAVVLKEA